MFSKLLLVAAAAFTYGSNLTLKSSYSYIDNEYPSYRIGDYEITRLEHVNSGGGQVRANIIQVVLSLDVFETLGEYEQVFISIPNYFYNSVVDLSMRMDYYNEDGSFYFPLYAGAPNRQLSASMLTILPYTIVDLPYIDNVFNPNNWDDIVEEKEIRLQFQVPFTAYSQPSPVIINALNDITLFTQTIGNYDDGYYDGYNDGFADAELNSDGTWLGSLVFGTIGGIVGLLFAISDFEVLGVSIMSIITLFVAIGIITIFLKVIIK